ncbi:ATP-NAD kinase, PpnK-type [Penicillium italicum]|uniref:ATP-NAD kinase, PpnK-type n=1 Tax=Penicillium italicum TaxID=40296 RepID=A0A0A2LBY8_PENIT|nr:ATP-NAD kinase, PpnK-type [Penicillium italicum]
MSHPLAVDVVDNTLKYTSHAGVECSIDVSDVLCVLSNPSTYSVLFFQETELDNPKSEDFSLKKIDIESLPADLSSFVTKIPSHLRHEDESPIVQVVVSTGSGMGKAKTVFEDVVRPLFTHIGLDNYEIYETESAQTIIELAKSKFLERALNGVPQTIILLSGDGGLIDILEIFYKSKTSIDVPPKIALIPCGTGNAMASSIGLRSGPVPGLSTLLRGSPSSIPVFAAKFSPGGRLVIDEGRQRADIDTDAHHTLYGAVVASWGLHAALVADSDTSEYRKFGVDRFKMAANELLYPSDGTPPHRFKGKITLTTSNGPNEARAQEAVEGLEHIYALATLVPRLEKEFLISPDSVPLDGQMRFIRFGPMSAEDAMQLMTLAYQGGRHVTEDTVTYTDIEQVRIDFQEDDERWRRVCIDGKIVAVEKGGWVEIHSMLITARTYSASQTPDQGAAQPYNRRSRFHTFSGWQTSQVDTKEATEMLLIHQVGSVRVGEVVSESCIRYTITYTPAADPILPIPSNLYVRVKNTSAIPLRAAYLHGPYTLYAACYPSQFDPNTKYERQDLEGIPQFEPYLKAGGGWDAVIKVPAYLLEAHDFGAPGQGGPASEQSVSWIVEIQSQVIFSSSAAVHFELLVGRDENSLAYFSGGAWSSGNGSSGPPAKLQDHWLPETRGSQVLASKGVYSKAIALHVDDTTSLWSNPPFPSSKPASKSVDRKSQDLQPSCDNPASEGSTEAPMKSAKKKVHLVLITHGLHSNLGADMLYLKESIDAAIRKSKKTDSKAKAPHVSPVGLDDREIPTSKSSHVEDEQNCEPGDNPEDDDEEQVIVRGFSGNAVRTERGIQYLGKRLAKYVLLLACPDQPHFPLKGSKSDTSSRPFSARKERAQPFAHSAESVTQENAQEFQNEDHAYQITSISFVGHSLGGLVQTYAIAYIQKHLPHFFEQIKPVNFIALATPFLGLSNENPMYVRFALDLGLVGRTGQDLGLSWTAPKVRSGWGAIIAGRGESTKDPGHSDPGAKPLLRILPCGPAHEALKKFQHRTVYSNVVNDGIVPLRTSSLLFLDWKGLDRVEKARRDNGLVGTVAEWGWAELTGANSKSPRLARPDGVPLILPVLETGHQNAYSATQVSARPKDDILDEETTSPRPTQFPAPPSHGSSQEIKKQGLVKENSSGSAPHSPLDSLFSLFRLNQGKDAPNSKNARIYKRSQTLRTFETGDGIMPITPGHSSHEQEGVHTPPKTTFFESAGDVLMPPLPPADFILDPASRPRTIFHDRIYHPGDIPPPLPAKRRTLTFGSLQGKQSKSAPSQHPPASIADNESGLKVEEKIARAYHRDMTWRKVLVRLEPDAHNNIIVRRMFTNAYGWPVVKHLVDTHFGHTPTAETDDSLKQNVEMAKSPDVGPTSSGDEVEGQSDSVDPNSVKDTDNLPNVSDLHVSEDLSSGAKDTLPAEDESHTSTSDKHLTSRQDSARWTDCEVVEGDSESGLEVETNA